MASDAAKVASVAPVSAVPSRPRVAPATVLAGVVAIAFAVPGLLVVWRALRADIALGELWSDLAAPLWRTIQLATLVSATAAVLGTALAWLLVRTDLPGRRLWRLVLVLPLALP